MTVDWFTRGVSALWQWLVTPTDGTIPQTYLAVAVTASIHHRLQGANLLALLLAEEILGSDTAKGAVPLRFPAKFPDILFSQLFFAHPGPSTEPYSK